MRSMIKVMFNIHKLCYSLYRLLHFFLWYTVIFKCKGDILCHRQSDKLTIRILQNGSHRMTQIKNTAFCHILAIHKYFSCDFARISVGNQTVNTAGNRTFTAAACSCYENFLSRVNIQIDVVQRRFCLRIILKSKILK